MHVCSPELEVQPGSFHGKHTWCVCQLAGAWKIIVDGSWRSSWNDREWTEFGERPQKWKIAKSGRRYQCVAAVCPYPTCSKRTHHSTLQMEACVLWYPVRKIPLTYSFMHALQVNKVRPAPSLVQEMKLNGKQKQTLLPCFRHLPFLKKIGQLWIWRRWRRLSAGG